MAENQVYLIKSGNNSFVEETEAVVGISGGKVGIGTTVPEADLHVTGSVKIGGDLAVDGTFTTINSNTISVDDKNIELGSTDSPTDITADGGGITVKGASDKTFNWSGNNSAWTSSEHLYLANGKHFSADELRALDGDGLKLADATTSGVLIKGGKVGIHQTTPVYDLDVDGSGNFTSLYVDGNAVLTGEGSIFGKWEDGAAQGEIFYTGGNVGVGTNNPEHKLHVVGDSVVDGNFVVNGTSGNLNVSNFNVSGDSIVLNYLGDTLTGSRGGLIIKDSSNASKSLEYVEGSDFWLSSESVQIADGKELQTDKVRAIDAGGLSLQDDGGNGIFIEDGGQVGVNTSSPNYSLDVNGSAKIGSDFYAGNAFKISAGGAVGDIAPASDGDIIKWDDSSNKWVAGANVGGGGGGGVGEVPLATIDSLPSGQSIYQIDFAETYNVEPRIATQLEIDGEGSIIPYVVSGVSTSGYHLIFAQDIPNNNYRIHTTFGGRDVHWETGAGASLYYNDGDVNIQRNFTIGGNLTVNGTTTTVNTETVEIEDHNLVIAANTGYNQLDSQYPAGGAYAGILWGTGDAGEASPVSLTYQTNKGFAFEGGNVGIGTTSPGSKLTLEDGDIKLQRTDAGNSKIIFSNTSDNMWAVAGDADGDFSIEKRVKATNAFINRALTIESVTTEAMRIDSEGKVGIGTTNPDLTGLQLGTALVVSSETGGDIVAHKSGSSVNVGDVCGSLLIANSDTDGSEDHFVGMWGKVSSTNGSQDLHFAAGRSGYEGDAPHLTIDSDGNVGIGTTDPGVKLDVNDNTVTDNTWNTLARFRPDLGDQPSEASIHIQSYPSTTTPNDRKAGIQSVDDAGNARSLIFNKDGGNVGIGTTSPSAKLTLPASESIHFNNSSGETKAEINSGTAGTLQIQGDYDLRFKTTNEAMRINSSGNVGIGTTNPGVKLQVDTKSNLVYADSNQGSNFALTLKNTPDLDGGSAGNNVGIAFYNYSTGNSFGRISYISSVQEQDGVRYSNLVFGTDDGTGDRDEKMRITASGNVGIGTTDPGYKLDVREAANGAYAARIFNGGGDSYGLLVKTNSGTSESFPILDLENTSSSVFRVQANGNVGIGTPSPSARLEVKSASDLHMRVGNLDQETSPIIRFQGQSSVGQNHYADIQLDAETGTLLLKDPGTSAPGIGQSPVAIDSSGNVGIGTTSPSSKITAISTVDSTFGNVTPSASDCVISLANQPTTEAENNHASLQFNLNAGTHNHVASISLVSESAALRRGALAFCTDNGTNRPEAMRIDSDGNVGIGIINPEVPLEVNGGVDNSVVFRGRCDSALSHTGSGAGNNGRFNLVAFSSDAGNDYGGGIKIQTRDGVNVFHDRMTINESGNVGIGATNPARLLHLKNSNSAIAFETPIDANGSAFAQIKSGRDGSSGYSSTLEFATTESTTAVPTFGSNGTGGSGFVTRMLIDSAGNVGIGTTSPDVKLDLQVDSGHPMYMRSGSGANDNLFIFENPAAGPQLRIYEAGTSNVKVKISTHDDTYFNGGNVGIGTTNPAYKLHVVDARNGSFAAEIRNTSTGTSGATGPHGLHIKYQNVSPDQTHMDFLRCSDSTATRMRVYSDGDVWTSDSGFLTSDERLKTNIVDATPKLEDIKKLKVRNFEWIPELHPARVGEKKIGFIAQELEQVFPGLVGEHDMNLGEEEISRKSVRLGAMIPILVKGIQEQQQIIESLQSQNASLESRISALES